MRTRVPSAQDERGGVSGGGGGGGQGTAARFCTARYTPDKWPTSCVVTRFFMTSDFPEPSEPKKKGS